MNELEIRKAKSIVYIINTLEKVYKTNFSMNGLIEGHPNFDTSNNFNEGLNMLIEACTDNRIPEETHGLIVSAATLLYAYARDNDIPSVATVQKAFDK